MRRCNPRLFHRGEQAAATPAARLARIAVLTPDMRLKSLQEKIAWNLEEYIWNEKQGRSDIDLTAFQPELRRQSQGQSVADVDAWKRTPVSQNARRLSTSHTSLTGPGMIGSRGR